MSRLHADQRRALLAVDAAYAAAEALNRRLLADHSANTAGTGEGAATTPAYAGVASNGATEEIESCRTVTSVAQQSNDSGKRSNRNRAIGGTAHSVGNGQRA